MGKLLTPCVHTIRTVSVKGIRISIPDEKVGGVSPFPSPAHIVANQVGKVMYC